LSSFSGRSIISLRDMSVSELWRIVEASGETVGGEASELTCEPVKDVGSEVALLALELHGFKAGPADLA